MKIAVILPEIEPFSPIRGGAIARWVAEVYPYLTEFDFEILAPPNPQEYLGLPIKHLVAYEVAKPLQRMLLSKLYGRLKHIYPLEAAIRGRFGGYGIFHIHNRPLYVLFVRALNAQARIVLHMHNDHLLGLQEDRLTQVIKSTNAIVACSQYLVQGILERAPKAASKVHVVYNGVNIEEFVPSWMRKEANNFPLYGEHPTVLFVGRLIKEKGVHQLVKAMKRVIQVIPQAQLVVVGSSWFGSDRETPYIQELREASLEIKKHIHFTGYVPHKEIPKYYAYADVFVCPSVWQEPFPLVILEAMACGIPIIASDRGGIPEAIGNAGLLINPEDTEQLADAIIQVLESPTLADNLGRKARKRVEELFTWRKIAQDFQSVLEEL